jgi:predicted methyltransferase
MQKLALGLLVVLVACSGHRPPAPTAADDYRAIVATPDRTDGDRALDAGRNPAALLAFAGIRPGMRVAELMAGGGYTTELLARAVAPDGRVWAQNNRLILDRFAATPWSQRLARPALRDVVRVDRELEDPLPPDAHDLDVVVMVLFYHDTVWMGVDRDRMNRAVYAHLRPGGLYVIVDHSGRPGTGTSEVKTLHRIDEATVRAELERAGFRLARTADFLRNPDDPRDWNDSPSAAGARRGTSDRFVLAYERPR